MAERDERQEKIRTFLAQAGRLGVEELATRLSVTPMTIRRDLSAMEKNGILTRTHGGCVLRTSFVHELPYNEKERQQQGQKAAIASEVVRRLPKGSSVYLDTGTTAVRVAHLLPTDANLRIFTNNLRVALDLFDRPGVEVTVFGGHLGSKSPDLTGAYAIDRLREFHFDIAVLGADAIDPDAGTFFAADVETAMLSRQAQRQASQTLLAVDSSKFGKCSLTQAGHLEDGVVVITDNKLAPETRQQCEECGAMVCTTSSHSLELP